MDIKENLPFELFYLEELLAEGVISKELFDRTRTQLVKELDYKEEQKP